jgi:hypothetical protein
VSERPLHHPHGYRGGLYTTDDGPRVAEDAKLTQPDGRNIRELGRPLRDQPSPSSIFPVDTPSRYEPPAPATEGYRSALSIGQRRK